MATWSLVACLSQLSAFWQLCCARLSRLCWARLWRSGLCWLSWAGLAGRRRYKIGEIMKNIENPRVFLTFWAAHWPTVAKVMDCCSILKVMFQNTCVFLCFGAGRVAGGIRRYTPSPYQHRQNPYSRSCLGNDFLWRLFENGKGPRTDFSKL